MPNRILHERICVSETIAQLTSDEERFFYRLIVQCDDFGRFDGRASVIRARCFALQLDEVEDEDVARWLGVLENVGLVQTYTVDGRDFLRVTTWERHQQTRAKRSKYPAPLDDSQAPDSNGYQVPAYVPEKRETRSEKREPVSEKREASSTRDAAAPPHPPKGKAVETDSSRGTDPPERLEPTEDNYAVGLSQGLSRDQVDQAAANMLAHWKAHGARRADWHAALEKWLRDEPKFSRQPRASPPSQNAPPPPSTATLARASSRRISYLKVD